MYFSTDARFRLEIHQASTNLNVSSPPPPPIKLVFYFLYSKKKKLVKKNFQPLTQLYTASLWGTFVTLEGNQ